MLSCVGNAAGSNAVDYMVIAGGGGWWQTSGQYIAGGGGAGGYLEKLQEQFSASYTAKPLAGGSAF